MAIKNLLNVKEHSMLHLGDSARGHHCSRPNMTLLAACLRTTRALPTVVTLAPPANMEKYYLLYYVHHHHHRHPSLSLTAEHRPPQIMKGFWP